MDECQTQEHAGQRRQDQSAMSRALATYHIHGCDISRESLPAESELRSTRLFFFFFPSLSFFSKKKSENIPEARTSAMRGNGKLVLVSSDEAHFWLNGYVNKQNCRIWSEANPQVYVETPLHLEKLTVWCALWAGGILLQKR
ncbi:hypothetical protein TNCV_4507831 [Trichonephila clavipes]|nr:hypothetical protein TNCV_4507831 [Trichonephila clavipes]